ncbi:class I SAM-dependent methyltransferase [Lusitaniella coriacea]|uniref:class I SAM-dependent methyltransferase n=1 Tax=Lusitaniella coriacea TaxID=1983105 RepID=UPI003CF7821E
MNDLEIFHFKEKFFDRWSATYDFLLVSVFYQAVHKRLLEFVKLPKNPRILDLGCGTGRLLHRLAGQFPELQGTGFDLSPQMLNQACQNNSFRDRVTYIQGNAETLPFEDEQFDAVFNTISFLHYPNPQLVLSEVRRVLKPQGRFYLADYALRDDLNRLVPFSRSGLQFYSPQQREQLGQQVGLPCLSHHYLLGAILLSIFGEVEGIF